ncbi:MAG: hypothetical protein V5A87_03920 [Candidatus Bipolaricaulota bacterium]|nr:hypothetical protein [Candidatus Bipolaricaulota bacterium]MBS3792704.1 hypothetical protein [Candidatus Bipolaricaulota bacterium]
MIKINKGFRLLSAVLVLSLFLFPIIGYGNNGLTTAQQDQVEGILTDKYAELPGIEFEFSEQPDASFEELTFRSFKNLAISLPNLTDGLLIGLVMYGDTTYLSMAVELPEEMETDYGAGLVNYSTGEAVFASRAEISQQEQSVDKVSFDLSPVDEDSPNLELVIMGKRYTLETVIPKSL